MRIVFFEVKDWERSKLNEVFPDSILTTDKLTKETSAKQEFKDAEIASVFINSSVIKDAVNNLPNLKYIATRSTGYDHIDVEYCKNKRIPVSNVPEYGSNTVAEHTFALLLNLTRKVYQSVNQSKHLNFEHDNIRGIDLCGKIIGIVGLGKIGTNVLRIALGFGMKVLAYNRSENNELKRQYQFQYVDLDNLLQNSDVITLHLPLTQETRHIINKENIMKLKKGCYIINTARGGLVDTEALVFALNEGLINGVGLDVLEEEKELSEEIVILTSEYQKELNLKNLVYNHILINHPKVLITPHNAFNSEEALARITDTTIENIRSFLNNNPVNIIR